MKRKKKKIIRTRHLTNEEVAKEMGISKKRLAWIVKILEEIWEQEAGKIKKSKNKPRK